MPLSAPSNLKHWIDSNRHLLKPPVGNQQIFIENTDFIVMVVGGPNSRKDYHYNEGEELFYQLEGDITLKVVDDGEMKDIIIREGDMFLLPPKVPHCPVRGENTVGLVIERYRHKKENDGFLWFCKNCGYKLHSQYEHISDIVAQLPPIMAAFNKDESKHLCPKCGTIWPL
jgi:3-hydroxyanthranilate 3,4-dioxygenase